ncbi:MAG: ABC transporter permease [Vicinamibacterales bacterium]
MWQDIRVAWRFLIKRRTATVVAVLTLGVAVAVCTIAVGVLDQAFWRSIAAERGDELVTVYNSRLSAPQFQVLSYPDYADLRDRLRDGVDLAAFVRIENTLGGGTWPARVWGELVSGNYFGVLGAKPFVGRLLTADDDRILSREPVVVLGYDFWRRSFGADPAVIGKTIRLGRNDYTVLGVTPPGFHGPAYASDFWIPLMMAQQVFGRDLLSRPEVPLFQTVARPHPGTTLPQIQGRVRAFETSVSKDGWRLAVFPAMYLKFWPAYRSAVARFLGAFVGLSACILIISCANLAGLLIARAGERQRELALRQALGATRVQLVRRLAAESIILMVLGGVTGVLFAYLGASFVERVPVPVPARLGVSFDARLGVICLAVSLVASLLFTAMSALKGLRSDIQIVLVSSAGTLAPKAGAQRMLVIAQVAVSCILLTVGGLLLRSALNVNKIDVGFDSANRVIARVGLSDQGYTASTGNAFYRRLQEDLERHPQVEAVALGWLAPLAAIRAVGTFLVSGSSQPLQARYNVVGPAYFKTLNIELRGGREFEPRDTQSSEPVAIVNEVLAARISGDVIGESVKVANETSPRRIVGVVREIKYNGITEPSQPFVYLPLAQAFRPDVFVHLRTRLASAPELLRAELQTLDPNVALSDVRTLADQLHEARAMPRASAMVSGGASVIAVLLALVGVYGVLTTSVERRKRELAIRAALGATPLEIGSHVILEGAGLTGIGLALGLGASFGAGRIVADLLFGVEPHDATVFAVVPLLVLTVSAMSWLAPARRAASVDPAAILRSE